MSAHGPVQGPEIMTPKSTTNNLSDQAQGTQLTQETYDRWWPSSRT